MYSKGYLKNKKGSFIILALMIFASVIIVIFSVMKASAMAAIGSATDTFGVLWGKSILGEYDLFLKERYGIFGFYGNEYTVEEKIRKYADYSFGEKQYVSLDEVNCCLEEYSLTNTVNFEKQVYDAVTYGTKPLVKGGGKESEREIFAQWIIKALPSYGKTEKWYVTGTVKKIKEGITADKLVGQLAVDNYIFRFFNRCGSNENMTDTFFQYEIEYIVNGKLSDEKNRKGVSDKIKIMRNMLNLYYLYTCEEKREAALLLAEAITPGAGAVLTQAVILETWAYSEAVNDINILYDGKTVPLLKKDSNWALSLENVFNSEGEPKKQPGESEKGYILPQSVAGEEYSTYLKILVAAMPKDTKLLRMMDLIQINGKYVYVDHFLLKDYHLGLDYEITVNGRKHTFKETY